MERVDLERTPHAERQRWRAGGEWDELAPKVAVGTLADGRWYVRIYARNTQVRARPVRWPNERHGCVYAGERQARGTARRWMRTLGGEWVEA